MSGRTSTRQVRQARPELEGLEDRQLLVHPFIDKYGFVHNLIIPPQDLSRWQRAHTHYVPPTERRYEYTTNEGTHVILSLYGDGNLLGTSFNPATDAVDIRFAETNENSGLIGKVYGGNGQANLDSLLNTSVPADSVSGVGSSLIRVVNLKNFNLVQGGRINLTGGVQTFLLNSTAPNTQISLREIPPGLIENQQSTTTENGVTLGYAVDLFGARSLTTTAGTFVAGANLLPTAVPTSPNQPATPAGVVVSINHVDGLPRAEGIGSPTVYGYDPTTDSLVEFAIQYNATTKTFSGTPTVVATDVLGKTGVEAGVSLGRYNGQLVVLVSDGTTLYGFNALNGAPVGKPVSLAPLITPSNSATPAMPNPTRLGNVDSFTVIGDPNAPAPNGLGLLQIINVTASLDSGTVVPIGVPFASSRAFGLSGGMTGIPGSSTLYTAGGGYLDPYQPNAFELGVLSLTPTGATGSLATATFTESSRNALTNSSGTTIPSDTHGGTASSKDDALASFNLNLALVTGSNGTTNTVTLFNPTTFASAGTITLDYGNLLSGMSSVFYPQLQGSALVDIQGNVQSFRANDALGLVLNDTGNLNLAKINSAVDTTILGAPFGHAQIPHRQNVEILSTPRAPGTRNGVTLVPSGILPVGPLKLP